MESQTLGSPRHGEWQLEISATGPSSSIGAGFLSKTPPGDTIQLPSDGPRRTSLLILQVRLPLYRVTMRAHARMMSPACHAQVESGRRVCVTCSLPLEMGLLQS